MSDVFVTRIWPGDAGDKLSGASLSVEVWQDYEAPNRDEMTGAVAGVRALITTIEDVVDAKTMDAAGATLKIIAQAGVGFDNIDLDAARSRGIWVTNAPGVLDECTADLAFALMMAVARRIPEAAAYVKEDQWSGWHPSLFAGAEFNGATVGVAGLGRIGMAFARRCEGFNMNVLYSARTPKDAADARGYSYRSLDELLTESDFVSLHVPLTTETRGLIGDRELSLMKSSAILVNTARGGVVNTEALMNALANQTIAGAGLDVTDPEPMRGDHPILKFSNVVVLPHVGSAGLQTRKNMYELAVNNVLLALAGDVPRHALVTP